MRHRQVVFFYFGGTWRKGLAETPWEYDARRIAGTYGDEAVTITTAMHLIRAGGLTRFGVDLNFSGIRALLCSRGGPRQSPRGNFATANVTPWVSLALTRKLRRLALVRLRTRSARCPLCEKMIGISFADKDELGTEEAKLARPFLKGELGPFNEVCGRCHQVADLVMEESCRTSREQIKCSLSTLQKLVR